MAAPNGHPRYGGRTKGTLNKATLAKRQAVPNALIAEKLTPEEVETLEPLPVMLRVMRSRVLAGDDAGALGAAAACAPYCHARLSANGSAHDEQRRYVERCGAAARGRGP